MRHRDMACGAGKKKLFTRERYAARTLSFSASTSRVVLLGRGWKLGYFAGYLQAAHVGLFLQDNLANVPGFFFFSTSFTFKRNVFMWFTTERPSWLPNTVPVASTLQKVRHKFLQRKWSPLLSQARSVIIIITFGISAFLLKVDFFFVGKSSG